VSRELEARLSKHCDGGGVTQSAVVEEALRLHLDGTEDRTLLFRRLDRLGRAVARLQRDVELQAEAFGVFVRLWFAHTPSVAAEARGAVQRSAEGRYRQYVQYVAEQFSGGRRFIDDLPREELGPDVDPDAGGEGGEGARAAATPDADVPESSPERRT
jgi:hypothetical protein